MYFHKLWAKWLQSGICGRCPAVSWPSESSDPYIICFSWWWLVTGFVSLGPHLPSFNLDDRTTTISGHTRLRALATAKSMVHRIQPPHVTTVRCVSCCILLCPDVSFCVVFLIPLLWILESYHYINITVTSSCKPNNFSDHPSLRHCFIAWHQTAPGGQSVSTQWFNVARHVFAALSSGYGPQKVEKQFGASNIAGATGCIPNLLWVFLSF